MVLVLTHSTHVYTYTHTLTQSHMNMHTDKQRATQNLHMHSCTHTHAYTHSLVRPGLCITDHCCGLSVKCPTESHVFPPDDTVLGCREVFGEWR